MMKPNLLWVGDAGCPSGFAKATHNILETLRHHYNVTVLGINYRGDPHEYPYPIWAAAAGGDAFGVKRLVWMCDMVKPDVIILQNDGWNIQFYVQRLRKKLPDGNYEFPEHASIPIVAIVAVDGKNFNGKWLDNISHTIFWTEFALNEARAGGYQGCASVIPLGVDLEVYHPMNRDQARWKRRLPDELLEAFIVGSINRNQPRKRWDLLVRYFAEWINSKNIRDAYLFLHTAPTGDVGINVAELAWYYNVVDRLAVVTPEMFYGFSEVEIAETYNCFDVNVSTTQGEGFGLTTLESMACGTPQILPDWAALGDWAKGAAWMIPCPTTHSGSPYVNVIGGVPDEDSFVSALDGLYGNKDMRKASGERALERAKEPRFKWSAVGQAYVEVLCELLEPAELSKEAVDA